MLGSKNWLERPDEVHREGRLFKSVQAHQTFQHSISKAMDHACQIQFTRVALNNESGLLIVCVPEGRTHMMAYRVTRAFALLICLLCAWPYSTNAQHAETYVVPVTVVSRDGKPLTSLQSQNLRIHNRGVELKNFSLDTSPRR